MKTHILPTPAMPPSWEKRINELVAAAPPLTPAQIDRLATLLHWGAK